MATLRIRYCTRLATAWLAVLLAASSLSGTADATETGAVEGSPESGARPAHEGDGIYGCYLKTYFSDASLIKGSPANTYSSGSFIYHSKHDPKYYESHWYKKWWYSGGQWRQSEWIWWGKFEYADPAKNHAFLEDGWVWHHHNLSTRTNTWTVTPWEYHVKENHKVCTNLKINHEHLWSKLVLGTCITLVIGTALAANYFSGGVAAPASLMYAEAVMLSCLGATAVTALGELFEDHPESGAFLDDSNRWLIRTRSIEDSHIYWAYVPYEPGVLSVVGKL